MQSEQQKTAHHDLNSNKSVPVHLYNLNGPDSKLYSKQQSIYENRGFSRICKIHFGPTIQTSKIHVKKCEKDRFHFRVEEVWEALLARGHTRSECFSLSFSAGCQIADM